MIKEKFLNEKWRVYTAIDGNPCNEEKRVGYCWSELHRGYLTAKLLKEHQCCEKNCKHFQKYEQSQYWKQKEKHKEIKKQAKAKAKQEKQTTEQILKQIRELTEDDDNFYAVGIERDKNGYIIRYISFDYLYMSEYIRKFKIAFGINVYLREIKTTYENKLYILKLNKLI